MVLLGRLNLNFRSDSNNTSNSAEQDAFQRQENMRKNI